MKKKKILFLGGAFSQLPAIEYAKKRGHYVITTGYLPDSPGHRIADEFHLISTIDKEKILKLSEDLQIDAISAFASDPAAPTAAFVSEKLHLVGSPFQAVNTLSDKGLFRKFLEDHHYPCPWFLTGSSLKEIESRYTGGRAVIKPVDSSGSKGIKIIETRQELAEQFDFARKFSRCGTVILEEYIESKGPHIHGDGFVLDGKLVFICLGDHYYSTINPVVPVSTVVPSMYHQDIMPKLVHMVEEVVQRAGLETGGINIEMIRAPNDIIYIMEIGPRSGGNFIPQLMHKTTGFDLVRANVDVLFKEPLPRVHKISPLNHYALLILSSKERGYFVGLNIPEHIRKSICMQFVNFKPGDMVPSFENAGDAIGFLILKFNDRFDLNILLELLDTQDWIQINHHK